MNGIENRLDHCKVTVSPSLNPDHESVEVPGDLLRSLSIIGKVPIQLPLVLLFVIYNEGFFGSFLTRLNF